MRRPPEEECASEGTEIKPGPQTAQNAQINIKLVGASRFGTHSSRSRRVSHELFHVFEHTHGQRLFDRRKVVEKFRQRPAVFQVIK